MFEDLLNIVEQYKNVILPAVEQGDVPLDTQLINGFLQFVHVLYERISYDGGRDEKEYTERINAYVKSGNGNAILGMMYSFLYGAPSIMALQEASMKYMYLDHCRMAHIANYKKINEWKKIHNYSQYAVFEGRGVIYSAITGGYDRVSDPEYVSPDFDYILFTDNPSIKSDVWKIKHIKNEEELDNVRLARKIKILGYKYLEDYDFSVWTDGKINVKGDVCDYIKKYKGMLPILCFPHYLNSCIYEEYEVCENLKKDDSAIMRHQIERYRSEGYPEYNGMADTCVLVREHKNNTLNRVMDTWWDEVKNGSRRDQLSFNYSFWKNDFMYDTSELYCYGNPFFSQNPHL